VSGVWHCAQKNQRSIVSQCLQLSTSIVTCAARALRSLRFTFRVECSSLFSIYDIKICTAILSFSLALSRPSASERRGSRLQLSQSRLSSLLVSVSLCPLTLVSSLSSVFDVSLSLAHHSRTDTDTPRKCRRAAPPTCAPARIMRTRIRVASYASSCVRGVRLHARRNRPWAARTRDW
jgi:hypothetical protein